MENVINIGFRSEEHAFLYEVSLFSNMDLAFVVMRTATPGRRSNRNAL